MVEIIALLDTLTKKYKALYDIIDAQGLLIGACCEELANHDFIDYTEINARHKRLKSLLDISLNIKLDK